jgi:hypothetical protein
VIRARDVVFTIEGSAKTPPFLSGPPIDWRWATTMSVQTTFFSALEERQHPSTWVEHRLADRDRELCKSGND